MRAILISTVVTIFFSSVVIAQNGTIKGKITDAISKEPLPGVNIFHGPGQGTVSDIDGNYELSLGAGNYTIIYKFIGFQIQERIIEIKAGETLVMDIGLEEEIKKLKTVVVSAGKFEQPIEEVTMSMDVLRPDLVDNKGLTNVQGAVDQTPGVTVVDSEPQVRGGSGYSFGAGSRVMIMVDDMPVLSGDAGRPKWAFLPIENLEQIEVLKGASSVLYGSAALSGVINIRTAYPKDKPKTKINFQTGVTDMPQTRYAAIYQEGDLPITSNISFFHSRKIGNLDLVLGGNVYGDQGFIGPEPEEVTVRRSGNNIILNGGLFQEPQVISGTGGDTTYEHTSTNLRNFSRRGRVNVNLRYRPKNIKGLNYGLNTNWFMSDGAGSLLSLDVDSGLYRNYPGSQSITHARTFNIDPFINYFSKNGMKHSARSRWYRNINDNNNNQSNSSDL
ncbi:MAG: carboxypeptidase-like regulatory domain-containing protein, partial [Flavobacteriales bacterium]|nr:carboxypeptidase-like regulatory domain-containing protein [Flavobacteriales bacterium]